MFARKVCLKIRPGRAVEYSRMLENEIIPVLRQQKGFHDEISIVSAERGEAVAISLWDAADNAEIYHRKTYPGILQALERVIEGEPEVNTFAVSNSTIHKIPNLPR